MARAQVKRPVLLFLISIVNCIVSTIDCPAVRSMYVSLAPIHFYPFTRTSPDSGQLPKWLRRQLRPQTKNVDLGIGVSID